MTESPIPDWPLTLLLDDEIDNSTFDAEIEEIYEGPAKTFSILNDVFTPCLDTVEITKLQWKGTMRRCHGKVQWEGKLICL